MKGEVPVEGEWRDWSSLPEEMLDLIVSKMHVNKDSRDDVNNFRLVCTQWRLWRRSHYPTDVEFDSPWLVQAIPLPRNLKLFHPLVERRCKDYTTDDIESLGRAGTLCSKHGWLLMSKGYDMFFYRPFSNHTIKLPRQPFHPLDLTGISFTSSPTSRDCTVFAVREFYKANICIYTISRGEKNWSTTQTLQVGYLHQCHSPVYLRGKLYQLCYTHQLCVFDPSNGSIEILHPSSPFTVSGYDGHSYLLDYNGKLVGVFLRPNEGIILVYEWDEVNFVWKEINDLGDYMLFLSQSASFAKRSTSARMRNKIYFPRFRGGYLVFYCLERRLFGTFENDIPMNYFDGTTWVPLYCCWMELTKIQNTTEALWFQGCEDGDDADQHGESDYSDDSWDDEGGDY